MRKKALIIGIGGQDGSLLADLLVRKNYIVSGTAKKINKFSLFRLNELNIIKYLNIYQYSIGNKKKLKKIIKSVKPHEIYMLAGPSKTNLSFKNSKKFLTTYIKGTIDLLDLNLELGGKLKIFFACSSEIFGKKKNGINFVNEDSRFKPTNPYGLAMLNVINLADMYRKFHNLYICTGIFFNHESYLRSVSFISRKITHNLAKFYFDNSKSFKIGNMNAKIDWTAAEDVVNGIFLSMQLANSDNYIFSSGNYHSVKDFMKVASKQLGINLYFKNSGVNEKCFCYKTNKLIAQADIKYYRFNDAGVNIGNSTKAKKILHWQPKVTFAKMIKNMLNYDMKKIKKQIRFN
jgi:GDPmannose 4,6-dehydratase